jgi:hypothetical protein
LNNNNNLRRRRLRQISFRLHPLSLRFPDVHSDLVFQIDVTCVPEMVQEAILNLQQGGKS